MIKEKDVLKAIVESRRADERTYYEDIEKYLGINRRFLRDNTGILKSFNAGINYMRFIFLFLTGRSFYTNLLRNIIYYNVNAF